MAALALALALTACGSQAPAAPEPTTETTARSAPGESFSSGEPAPASTPCAPQLGGFVEALEHLRRSLVIGVSYEQYVSELGTVRESYQQIPVAELDLACVSGPATSAEESFDGYLAAANAWGDCVSESGCETASLEPKLQHKWRVAAKQLREAQAAIEAS